MWEVSSKGDLKGQVAIVTGAALGIGAACAYALAREGSKIVIVDLLQGDEIINKIKNDFPSAEIVGEQIDIRDRSQVKGVIDRTVEKWGRIDIVVNNAGIFTCQSLEDITDEDWTRVLDTNLRGTFLFTQLSIFPHMKNQGYGKIINVSSISGIIGGMDLWSGSRRSGPEYAASKGGIIAFTKWVAKEVGQYGIYCNSVAPGPVQTREPTDTAANDPFDRFPIKRFGKPEDIAESVVFLASPASNYITGQVLRVCGGYVIG